MSSSSEVVASWHSSVKPEATVFEYPLLVSGPASPSVARAWMKVIPSAVETLESEIATRERKLHEEGIREGELRARGVFEEEMQSAREEMAIALRAFREERTVYFDRVEAEVVQLALAIARKVLNRESQCDPLVLSSVVRATMQKVEQGTKVVLRVHPAHAQDWRSHFATSANSRISPEVVADASLSSNRCVLQTVLGTSEIGFDLHMEEIERAFVDLMAVGPERAQAVQ